MVADITKWERGAGIPTQHHVEEPPFSGDAHVLSMIPGRWRSLHLRGGAALPSGGLPGNWI